MKPKLVHTAVARGKVKPTTSSESAKTRELLAVARRMGRMVREENRRWGLPLIVMRDGKIVEEPA